MMTSKERVTKALRFEELDRFPRDLWCLPGISMHRPEELRRLQERFPNDIERPEPPYGRGKRCRGEPATVGVNTDAYGCVWQVGEPGVIGEVKECPLSEWSGLDGYRLPWELLEESDFSGVDPLCAATERFVLAPTEVRPFERMQFLRGTEKLFMDLAWGEKAILELRDRLHEFYMEDIRRWCRTARRRGRLHGRLGHSAIPPHFPRYVEERLQAAVQGLLRPRSTGRANSPSSIRDGNIEAIYPDLVEIGVDAVNSQLFCMDIETLGDEYAGRIAFWGEIDRQGILPFGTRAEVAAAVRRVANALAKGREDGSDSPVRVGHPRSLRERRSGLRGMGSLSLGIIFQYLLEEILKDFDTRSTPTPMVIK